MSSENLSSENLSSDKKSKCVGCGVETTNTLCERCFRIRNYNEYKKVDINYQEFLDNLNNIKKDDLVVLVVDLMNVPGSFNEINNRINNKAILALNKFDLMPTNNEERYIKYFDRYNLNIIDIFCVSSKNNYNIDSLYECIKDNVVNNVYFIGYTNSGKSSLINKLIYNYSNNDTVITTSYLANTTLDLIKINLNNFTLIDTPGIISDNGINNLSDNILKKLSKSKRIKPITYQVRGIQYIYIEDIVELIVSDNDITIYTPSNIDVNRYYKEKNIDVKNEYTFNIDKTSDIVIPNIGFIKVKSGQVSIKTNNYTEIYVREPLI